MKRYIVCKKGRKCREVKERRLERLAWREALDEA